MAEFMNQLSYCPICGGNLTEKATQGVIENVKMRCENNHVVKVIKP